NWIPTRSFALFLTLWNAVFTTLGAEVPNTSANAPAPRAAPKTAFLIVEQTISVTPLSQPSASESEVSAPRGSPKSSGYSPSRCHYSRSTPNSHPLTVLFNAVTPTTSARTPESGSLRCNPCTQRNLASSLHALPRSPSP